MMLMGNNKSSNENKYALDFQGRISEENSSANDYSQFREQESADKANNTPHD